MVGSSAVLWDLRGTLVDSDAATAAAFASCLRDLGVPVPTGLATAIGGLDDEAVHAWCRSELDMDIGLNDWLRLSQRALRGTMDTLRPRADVNELFIELERHGRPQAIVSNADRLVVEACLSAVHLSSQRRISVSRNDVRSPKPDPEGYRRAAWLLAVEPSRCIVVENSEPGAAAGVAAGMRTLFWPGENSPTPAGAERVDSVTELTRLLQAK